LLNFAQAMITFFSAQLTSLQVFLTVVHALELVKQTDVSQLSIRRAWDDVSSALVDWIVFSTIEPDLVRRLSMTTSFLENSRLGGTFLKEPHLKRVVILRWTEEDWLIRHKVNAWNGSPRVRGLDHRMNLLLVKIPKSNARSLSAYTGKKTYPHCGIWREAKTSYWPLCLLEWEEYLISLKIDNWDCSIWKTESNCVNDRALNNGIYSCVFTNGLEFVNPLVFNDVP
jgi:hypothetical protein